MAGLKALRAVLGALGAGDGVRWEGLSFAIPTADFHGLLVRVDNRFESLPALK